MKAIRKIATYLSLAAVALAGATVLGSCSDDKDYPPVIIPADYGSGTWDSPMSVNQVIEGAQDPDVWVCGYIVGWIDTGISNAYSAETVKFQTPATVASNIILAATPDETNLDNCIPIQLVSGTDARKALNLVDNPSNLGRQVCLKGNGERYFGRNGLKSVSNFNWGDQGVYEEPKPDLGNVIYEASKSGGLDAFTFDNILLPEGGSFVWRVDAKYGLVSSAFIGGSAKASDSWAISPVIDLSGYKSATLSFRHAANKFDNIDNVKAHCHLGVRTEGGAWTEVAIPEMPEGTSWNFIGSGDIDLTSFAGKKVQIGFHYTSTTSVCGSWEIDNIQVSAAK